MNINVTADGEGSRSMRVRVELDAYRRIVHVIEPMENTWDIGTVIGKLREIVPASGGIPCGEKWSWFWYGKNGTAGHYQNGSLFYVPLSDIRVYPELIGEMLIRMNKSRLLG